MRDAILATYHALPPKLRPVVAALRGAYLRAWRYGADTDRLTNEALARDRWTTAQWDTWRAARLAYVLNRAATKVPYYREHWAARRRKGDLSDWSRLEHWPLLEKETLRNNPRSFVADDRSVTRMFRDHTSGTSGKSLDIWMSRQTVRAWYALFEARCRHWNGATRHDRWAIFGGQLVTPVTQSHAPFWVWNPSLRQLYLSSYHISPRTVEAYLDAIANRGVKYILGYPSAMHALARNVLDKGLSSPPLQFLLANAEPVSPRQREDIEQAFSCPLRETYGMAEIVANASECSSGRMHLWPEAGHIEVMGSDHGEDDVGELVCTGLLNDDMPLIRYRVGDSGSLGPADTHCACGRGLPILRSVEGRLDDVLYSPDGRAVGRLDPIFKSGSGLSEAQIIQEKLDLIRVRYVPDPAFTAKDAELIKERVRQRMGAVNVVLEQVDAIPRGTNGKFRAVVSNLSAAEREEARQSNFAKRQSTDLS